MRNLLFTSLLVVSVTLLAGCGAQEEPQNLLDSQKQAMDKAKALEEQMQKSLDERMEEVDKQTQ